MRPFIRQHWRVMAAMAVLGAGAFGGGDAYESHRQNNRSGYPILWMNNILELSPRGVSLDYVTVETTTGPWVCIVVSTGMAMHCERGSIPDRPSR